MLTQVSDLYGIVILRDTLYKHLRNDDCHFMC